MIIAIIILIAIMWFYQDKIDSVIDWILDNILDFIGVLAIITFWILSTAAFIAAIIYVVRLMI
jgi:hypothetical protein